MPKTPSIWRRLFFDGHGALDLFQMYFGFWLVLCACAIISVGSGLWALPSDAWHLLQYIFYGLIGPAMPTWLAKIWLNSKNAAPGQLAPPAVLGVLPGSDTDTAHP